MQKGLSGYKKGAEWRAVHQAPFPAPAAALSCAHPFQSGACVCAQTTGRRAVQPLAGYGEADEGMGAELQPGEDVLVAIP